MIISNRLSYRYDIECTYIFVEWTQTISSVERKQCSVVVVATVTPSQNCTFSLYCEIRSHEMRQRCSVLIGVSARARARFWRPFCHSHFYLAPRAPRPHRRTTTTTTQSGPAAQQTSRSRHGISNALNLHQHRAQTMSPTLW